MPDFIRPPLPQAVQPAVTGVVRDDFAPLRESFTRGLAAQGIGGAAFAVWADGELVVDLAGGTASTDSLFPLYSVTKSITAVSCWHAHEAGRIDVDAPLATVWPAFDRPATRSITLRDVLSHRSGLVGYDRRLVYEELLRGDDDAALEGQDPLWDPGTRHGYHAFSLGTVAKGVFRRVLDATVGEYLRSVLEGRDAEVWIGAPERVHERVLPVDFRHPAVSAPQAAFRAASPIPPSGLGPLLAKADVVNDARTYAADWPAGSGLSNARSLATVYGGLLDGSLVGREAVRSFSAEQARGIDEVLGVQSAYGTGVQLPTSILPMLSEASFGHEGAGGTLVFADPRYGVAAAWTTSVHPTAPGAATEAHMLTGALRAVLDERGRA